MVESKALVAEVADGASPRLVQKTVQLPDLASNQVLVKVSAVAQNPTDVQAFDTNAFGDGTVLGCDFAGTVEEVGSSVTRVSKGDIIAGLIWGGEVKGLGAYSEYTIADERICFKVPLDITLPEAATMLLAALTAYLALFSKDSLNIDATSESNTSLLIWGRKLYVTLITKAFPLRSNTTPASVGLYAIQIAELFRFKIVTTCSPHHFEHVQSRGVQHVFDYRDPEVVQKIKAAVPGIKYVFDTIGNDTSSVLGSQTIDEGGGTLCTVRPGKAFTEGVSKQTKVTDVLVWTAFLKEHRYREYYWPPNERDHQLATEFCESLPDLISRGTVLPNDVRILPGGLDAVETGFQEHRDGKISGTKLVYELERAPWSRR